MPKLTTDQALQQASRMAQAGQMEKARAIYLSVLNKFPKDKRANAGLAKLGQSSSQAEVERRVTERLNALMALYQQKKWDEVETSARTILRDVPNAFKVWTLLGIAYAKQKDPANAQAAYERAIAIKPDHAPAYCNMGANLREQGRLDDALKMYQYAIKVAPEYAPAYYNLGNTLNLRGHFSDAVAAFQKAVEYKPDYAEAHNNMGTVLRRLGRTHAAIDAFNRAIDINPDYASAFNNLGNTLRGQNKLKDAITALERALQINPDYASAFNNLGNALRGQNKLEDAMSAFERALQIKPDYAEALYNKGNILHDLDVPPKALEAYLSSLKLSPDNANAQIQVLIQQQALCDWNSALVPGNPEKLGVGTEAVPTFSLLIHEDNPERQLWRSQTWAMENFPGASIAPPATPTKKPQRLKVGYFSANLHDHAMLFLISGLLREHNSAEFEIYAYSYGHHKSGAWRAQAQEDVEHFLDVADHSDPDFLKLVRAHELDIAIDLMGYTAGTRSHLFQHRLAPVQISFLGYPGTMGAEFIDYFMVDATVVPPQHRAAYSEKAIYLPHSYFPNDEKRQTADTQTARADFNLPEDAFVFCCFNKNAKISPREFDIWMRLLTQIEGSVLWLIRSNIWAEENLRKEAQARGVDPDRLIFAEKLPPAKHLARHKHADLFLDTFNYNAHTTACDALWAGLPVVTKQGEQFAARVGASLLKAVGLPELITTTEEDYEALILDLVRTPKKLQAIREELAQTRLTQPLFDTKQFTRDFEAGLRQAYDLYFAGEAPRDITVKERGV